MYRSIAYICKKVKQKLNKVLATCLAKAILEYKQKLKRGEKMRLDRRKVQLLMAELGINQQTLALKSNASRQTISAVMNGRNCRLELLGRIAKALETKPENIIE